ncbi:MAG: hypothetical protein R3A44_08900 [Caldilineaceae bacterium]
MGRHVFPPQFRLLNLLPILLLTSLLLPTAPLRAEGAPTPKAALHMACDPEGALESGARYVFCTPAFGDNGSLMISLHQYIAPQEPLAPQTKLPDGTSIPDTVGLLGYAFAATSMRANGLNVKDGIQDIVDLINEYVAQKGQPDRIYLLGVSQGALTATLVAEQHPELISGALAACGPYGDFQREADYLTDFRVLFDYFFPTLLPPSPIEIPQTLIDDWDNHFATKIKPVIDDAANAAQLDELFAVSGAAFDANAADSQQQVVEDVLWYNVVGANDSIDKLGGQPYDNRNTDYSGSSDDVALNAAVERFDGEIVAREEITNFYQTSGQLLTPVVTMHNKADPVAPYWHAELYGQKIATAGSEALYDHVAVDSFGHCNFNQLELIGAFNRLVELADLAAAAKSMNYLPIVHK